MVIFHFYFNTMTNSMKLLLIIAIVNNAKSKIPLQKQEIHHNCLSKLLGETWRGKVHVAIASRNEALRPSRLPYIYLNENNAIKYLSQEVDKPNSYTIIPETIDSLDNVLMAITESPAFRIARYTVFVGMGIDMNEVVQVMWNYRLPNTLVVQTNNTNADIYKIQIFECAYAKADFILSVMPDFNCTTARDLPEFSFKKNFLNCPLNVIWTTYEPFVYSRNNTWGWKGIFIDLLEPFSYISQRQLTFITDDTDYAIEVSTAFSYSLIVQDMVNETQLYVGSSDLRTNELFHLSPILIEDDLIVLTPRGLGDYWGNLRMVLTRDRIIFALILSIVVVAIIYLLAKVDDGSDHPPSLSIVKILMFLFGVFLGTSSLRRVSKFWFLRLFIAIVLLLSIVFNSFTQGTLIQAMAGSDYEPPITNIKQLINSGLKIKAMDTIGNFLQRQAEYDEDYQRMYDNYESVGVTPMYQLVDKLIEQKNFATFAVKAVSLMKPNLEEAFGIFPLVNLNLCFAMKKNDYSAPEMAHWIGLLIQGGFVEKFKDLHLFRMAWKHSLMLEQKNFVLSMIKFLPALMLWAAGLAVATGGFILELLVYRFNIIVMRKIK